MEEIEVKFSPNQKLPPGYRVKWWEYDEHYHFVIENFESCMYATKWDAFKMSWKHYKENNNV